MIAVSILFPLQTEMTSQEPFSAEPTLSNITGHFTYAYTRRPHTAAKSSRTLLTGAIRQARKQERDGQYLGPTLPQTLGVSQ